MDTEPAPQHVPKWFLHAMLDVIDDIHPLDRREARSFDVMFELVDGKCQLRDGPEATLERLLEHDRCQRQFEADSRDCIYAQDGPLQTG